MEPVLLNPSTPAKPAPAHQNVPGTDGDESGFSPAMEKAINSVKEDNKQNDSSTSDDSKKGADPVAKTENSKNASDFVANTEDSGENSESNISNNALTGLAKAQDAIITHMPQSTQATLTLTSLPEQAQQNPLLSVISEEQPGTKISQLENKTNIPMGTENSLQGSSKAETLLLQQIQQILDQGKNNGPITITGSTTLAADPKTNAEQLQTLSNPLLAESDNPTIQSRQVGVVPVVPVNKTTTSQNSTKLEGSHQDLNEQFYNAKLGESKVNSAGNSRQSGDEQTGNKQQNKNEVLNTLNQTSASTGTDAKPGESTFGQQLTTGSMSTTPTTTPTSVEGKFAPGAHQPVPEHELVDNLIKKFSINPRLQTSKLTMQLNPAELGAIKIDILVKGDSIKANIVAQSQQVLETLEKQMPRLRSVLQEQGFTVDSFEVTMDSEGGNQRELFQEQFNSSQQEFASNGSSKNNNESFDHFLDDQNEDENSEESTGVNLTV